MQSLISPFSFMSIVSRDRNSKDPGLDAGGLIPSLAQTTLLGRPQARPLQTNVASASDLANLLDSAFTWHNVLLTCYPMVAAS